MMQIIISVFAFDFQVLEKTFRAGIKIESDAALFALAVLHSFHAQYRCFHVIDVEFRILEAELEGVKTGQKIKVTPFVEDKNQYEGTVTEINPLVDDKGLVKIKAQLRNGGSTLVDGMNVRIVVEENLQRMFVVPKDAVVERDGYHVVFLYKDGHAVWTYVDILHSNINSYAITGCTRKETTINEGDVIITSGNLNLADQTVVKVNR
jgi:multidrug efflux pump subunit AcrA (membrane-fusion protein)